MRNFVQNVLEAASRETAKNLTKFKTTSVKIVDGSLSRIVTVLMADLKKIYAAVDKQMAMDALDDFDGKCSVKYPKIAVSWRTNWANLATYFN